MLSVLFSGDPVGGIDIGTLAEFGITTDSTGKLVIDNSELDEVINNDFTAVLIDIVSLFFVTFHRHFT